VEALSAGVSQRCAEYSYPRAIAEGQPALEPQPGPLNFETRATYRSDGHESHDIAILGASIPTLWHLWWTNPQNCRQHPHGPVDLYGLKFWQSTLLVFGTLRVLRTSTRTSRPPSRPPARAPLAVPGPYIQYSSHVPISDRRPRSPPRPHPPTRPLSLWPSRNG
jgi:hypothetical protein